MQKPSETSVLEAVCREIHTEGTVSETHLKGLLEVFGRRSARAWEAVSEGRVKKYVFKPSGRVVWIVVGKRRDYLIMPAADYCSCDDFYFQFDRGHLCYHIIAQKLAEASGKFDLFEDDDQFFDVLIKEWKAAEVRVPKRKQRKAPKEEKDTP